MKLTMDWWLFTFFIGAILSLFLPIEPTTFYLAILMLFALFCYFFKPLRKSSGLMLGGAWMIFNGI
jgi:competence protein ComEC